MNETGIWKQVFSLYQKDFALMFRNKSSGGGILLFLFSSVIISYYALGGNYNPLVMNSLFWIILAFSVTTAVVSLFSMESYKRDLYYYSIVSPYAFVIAKLFLNIFIAIVLSFITVLLFVLFFGFAPYDFPVFLSGVVLGSCGFSLVLTLAASLASRSGGGFSLVAILALPLMVPVIMLSREISEIALSAERVTNYNIFLQSFFLDLLIAFLVILLFPYIWKE